MRSNTPLGIRSVSRTSRRSPTLHHPRRPHTSMSTRRHNQHNHSPEEKRNKYKLKNYVSVFERTTAAFESQKREKSPKALNPYRPPEERGIAPLTPKNYKCKFVARKPRVSVVDAETAASRGHRVKFKKTPEHVDDKRRTRTGITKHQYKHNKIAQIKLQARLQEQQLQNFLESGWELESDERKLNEIRAQRMALLRIRRPIIQARKKREAEEKAIRALEDATMEGPANLLRMMEERWEKDQIERENMSDGYFSEERVIETEVSGQVVDHKAAAADVDDNDTKPNGQDIAKQNHDATISSARDIHGETKENDSSGNVSGQHVHDDNNESNKCVDQDDGEQDQTHAADLDEKAPCIDTENGTHQKETVEDDNSEVAIAQNLEEKESLDDKDDDEHDKENSKGQEDTNQIEQPIPNEEKYSSDSSDQNEEANEEELENNNPKGVSDDLGGNDGEDVEQSDREQREETEKSTEDNLDGKEQRDDLDGCTSENVVANDMVQGNQDAENAIGSEEKDSVGEKDDDQDTTANQSKGKDNTGEDVEENSNGQEKKQNQSEEKDNVDEDVESNNEQDSEGNQAKENTTTGEEKYSIDEHVEDRNGQEERYPTKDNQMAEERGLTKTKENIEPLGDEDRETVGEENSQHDKDNNDDGSISESQVGEAVQTKDQSDEKSEDQQEHDTGGNNEEQGHPNAHTIEADLTDANDAEIFGDNFEL